MSEEKNSVIQKKWDDLNGWSTNLMADKQRFHKYLIGLVALVLVGENVITKLF